MSPREIDRSIAMHIFGWKWYNPPRACSLFIPPSAQLKYGHPEFLSDSPSQPRKFQLGMEDMDAYSTDPADSKQLRDKMRADGWHFTVEERLSKGVWMFAAHAFTSNYEGIGFAWSDTEEVAVALAALSAVGKPVTL